MPNFAQKFSDLRPVHYIILAASVGLIALLYFGVNTVPPAKEKSAAAPMAGAEGMSSTPHNAIKAASAASILMASRAKLPAHATDEIEVIEKELGAIRD